MKKILIAAAVLAATPVLAQPIITMQPNPTQAEGTAPRPKRERGIPTALAVEAAMLSNSTCQTNGTLVTTIVVDSVGEPIAMISNDGAATITQRIAMGKAQYSITTKLPSIEGSKAAPDVVAKLGPARPGGVPIMVGNDLVGAIAASGSPTGQADEVCVRAGLAKIQDRLK
jgi:uncharacterized protein GlcG (DUF336 family)